MKSAWQFLSENYITLKHNINILMYRENDKPLMQTLYDSGVQEVDLFVYNLSDMFNLSGTGVKWHILEGTQGPVLNTLI
jgi:hypothetical protein